jgi:multisubunit Na+/H+ antiporter MnhE subunit
VRGPAPRAASFAALLLLWLALVGTRDPTEVVAGLIATTIAAIATCALHAVGLQSLVVRTRSWLAFARGLARLPRDTLLVMVALVRRTRGTFQTSPLPRGRDWRRQAERGLGALAASLAPNTIVVDIDVERRHALRHELVARGDDPLR